MVFGGLKDRAANTKSSVLTVGLTGSSYLVGLFMGWAGWVILSSGLIYGLGFRIA